jgi:hypothetical protein
MTSKRRLFASSLVALAAAASSGCRDAPLAENVETNIAPLAHAGDMQEFDYSGSPVSVTLDGSRSSDSDGTIVTYRWLSGTDAADGGIGRAGPDPDDEVSPTVMLDAGTWTFTLFVIDDEGGVSQPSTVAIMVGSGIPAPVMACSDGALQTIAPDCRLCICGIDEMCRTATMNCTQACWDFYTCLQNSCGDVLDDMTALADCVRANCSAFFGGVGQYMALEPCLTRDPCTETCAASVQGM